MEDLELRRLARFCEDRLPAHIRDQVRLEYAVDKTGITLFECRAPWSESIGPGWTRQPIARFRRDEEGSFWTLYYPAPHGVWNIYLEAAPSSTLAPLLEELDRDPTRIFWG